MSSNILNKDERNSTPIVQMVVSSQIVQIGAQDHLDATTVFTFAQTLVVKALLSWNTRHAPPESHRVSVMGKVRQGDADRPICLPFVYDDTPRHFILKYAAQHSAGARHLPQKLLTPSPLTSRQS